MCVIMVADKARPDPLMIEAGYEANRDGAGVAWREGGKIKWKKGLDLPAVQNLAARLPLPYILHFRISTCGGTPKALTHPFPVSKTTTNDLEGSTDRVLFHNGHWNDWQKDMKEICQRTGIPLPPGKWSDSRAMAWCASIMGLGYLELLDQKIVVLGGKDKELILFGGLWYLCNDVVVSNKGWEGRYYALKNSATQRHSEKKIITGQVVSRPVIEHPEDCACSGCEAINAAEAALTGQTDRMKVIAGVRGPSADHPLTKARAEYQEALALWESKDLSMSKNRLKKLKRKLEEETYKFKKKQDREMAMELQSQHRMLR